MPIKIIGKSDEYIRKATCKNCSSVLEFLNSDIIEKEISDYTGDTDTVYYIVCPECNDNLYVKRR